MMSREDLQPLVHSSPNSGESEDDLKSEKFGQVRTKRASSREPAFIDIESARSNKKKNVFKYVDKTASRRQTFSALSFCIGAFSMGTCIGWASPSLSQLQSSDNSFKVNASEGGWIGALICLGGAIQGPITGWLMVRFGRRSGMILMSVPMVLGWLLIYNAGDVFELYLGRLVTGFASGGYSMIAPVYVGEIADPQIRGALGTMFQLMIVTGIFVMYTLGTYVTWQTLAFINAGIPMLLIAVLLFLKDSPTSYMTRGRPDLARKSLIWLRNSADIEDEIYSIQKSSEEAKRSADIIKVSNILCITDPVIRKPVYLVIFLLMNTQLSGINAVVTFTVNIFESAGSKMNPSTCSIVVGLVQLIATFLSSLIVNKVGRRPTLLWTNGVMIVSLLMFGTFFYMKSVSPVTAEAFGWLPLTAMVSYIVAFSFGLGPLSWLMLGELLSPRIAGIAGALASVINWSCAFLVTVCFNYLIQVFGDYGTYWLFALFCVIGSLVIWKHMPETRGKSLREIQDTFRR